MELEATGIKLLPTTALAHVLYDPHRTQTVIRQLIPKAELRLELVASNNKESTLNNREMLIYQNSELVHRIKALSGFAPIELEELIKRVDK